MSVCMLINNYHYTFITAIIIQYLLSKRIKKIQSNSILIIIFLWDIIQFHSQLNYFRTMLNFVQCIYLLLHSPPSDIYMGGGDLYIFF